MPVPIVVENQLVIVRGQYYLGIDLIESGVWGPKKNRNG